MDLIYSKYAGQDEWEELLRDFVHAIPLRIEAIESALRLSDADQLRRLIHQLRGACGSYGYSQVSDIATALELELDKGICLTELADPIDRFCATLASMTDAASSLVH